MRAENIEDIFVLSPVQEGLLFERMLDETNDVYLQQLPLQISGPFDTHAFLQAWQHMVDRHGALRTSFHSDPELEQNVQIVFREVRLPYEQHDWRELDEQTQAKRWTELCLSDAARGFDLEEPPLIRIQIVRCSEDVSRVLFTYHHLIVDGWSLSLLFKEAMSLYEATLVGEPLHLLPAPSYGEYIAWLQEQDLSASEAFWRAELQGFTEPTTLRLKRLTEADSPAERVHSQKVALSKQDTARLQEIARGHQLTLYTLVQGAWAKLLQAYSGAKEVLFGMTVSGRPTELESSGDMVGVFINTVPVRVPFDPETLTLEWLKQLRERHFAKREHENAPLYKVQGWSEFSNGVRLFDSSISFENYPIHQSLQKLPSGLSVNVLDLQDTSGVPIDVLVMPGDELTIFLNAQGGYVDPDDLARIATHLETLLTTLDECLDKPLKQWTPLTPSDISLLVESWNATEVAFPQALCLHQLFEQQVKKMPDRIAAEYQGNTLTYAELEVRANQLAQHLQALGIGPDVPVGICVERSLELVVALVGVLKAGGAYLPLDVEAPTARLREILQDANAPVLLAQSHLAEKLPTDIAQVVMLDTDAEMLRHYPVEAPTSDVTADHLVSIYYTSGSTGKPKGVANIHRGWVNRMLWMQRQHNLLPEETVLQKTTMTFDDSAVEIYWPLMVGARIALLEPGLHRDPRALLDAAIQYRAAVVQFVPSMLNLTLDIITPEDRERLDALRVVVSSGEALRSETVRLFLERMPGTLYNSWGATEVSIDSTVHVCTEADVQLGGIVSIGRPFDNNAVYVLDEHMQPVPIGIEGDLYLGGVGLARGYLNNPERTQQAFLPHPFVSGERLYKTGDRGYYRPDGSLQFLGRQDDQVKIRGIRVELGEVETVLCQQSGVKEAAVIAEERAPGVKRLIAFVVPEFEEAFDAQQLRSTLKKQLPDFMVPSFLIPLSALPLNSNGKIDRKQLQVPEQLRPELEEEFVEPEGLVEEKLAEIWSSVLQMERIGAFDNFFELGGHSLLATQTISLIRKTFGIEIGLRVLFDRPTIALLAEAIEDILLAQMEEEGALL